jgi:hypothetical protein
MVVFVICISKPILVKIFDRSRDINPYALYSSLNPTGMRISNILQFGEIAPC